MSESFNPYQSPQAPPAQSFGPPFDQQAAIAGVWRKGDLLVMDKRAQLPNVCVKSNLPAERFLKRKLAWHHPLISISILASPLIYIILAAILTKRATIHIGLTEEWHARRRTRLIVTWLLILTSAAMLVGGFVLVDQMRDVAPLMFLGALILFIAGLIFGVVATRLVTPTKITDDLVFIKGVHPDFLAGLPEFPYPT